MQFLIFFIIIIDIQHYLKKIHYKNEIYLLII